MLQTSLNDWPGLSPGQRDHLARLGLVTLRDLLYHFPRDYEDLSDLRPIAQIADGLVQTVQGEVISIEPRKLFDGNFLVAVRISDDGKHFVEGVWFNQGQTERRFRFGQRVSFSGKVQQRKGIWQITSPQIQYLDDVKQTTPGIVPIYPLTEDLRPEVLRKVMARALDEVCPKIEDFLPEEIRQRYDWPTLGTALRAIHFPKTKQEAEQARRRFVYQQLFLVQAALGLRRGQAEFGPAAFELRVTSAIDERIRKLFPFAFTEDQNRAVADICRDLASNRPMQRLIQADVGAGKTAIAVYAMLVAVANRWQAALMAPTEVLARQHFRTLDASLSQSRVRRLLLTGSLTAKERREARERIQSGDVDLVIGTQSLVQEGVNFARLGLVVIDEQHKFGVHQRAKVRDLGGCPHYLVMTATPIPRTVALTMFGDLDFTLLRQLPPGRQPVDTDWLRESQREEFYEQLRCALREGKQGYIVCPRVEESSTSELRSAERMYKELAGGALREFRLGLLHGKQGDEVKEDVMERFRNREIDVLICTTVVEVGVDVPNATWLVIEHAERFGLSQLHQLRGRVARGPTAGVCRIFAETTNEQSQERLSVFLRINDGFTLAEEDARIRGAGEVFGTKQHGTGDIDLRLGELMLIDDARRDALDLLAEDAGLRSEKNELLRRTILGRYGATMELADVG
jgi:ATP-dependent DNA helicase RecG